MIEEPSNKTSFLRNTFLGSHSIYHQALPNNFDRLDLTRLNDLEPDLAYQLIEALLKLQPWQREVKADFHAHQSFLHYFFENRNAGKNTGVGPVHLGFPLLITQYDGQMVVAPIFLWPLQVEPAARGVDTWNLESQAGSVRFNPFIESWLQESEANEQAATLGIPTLLDAQSLTRFCNELAIRLGIDTTASYPALSPFPEPTDLTCLAEDSAICWSGVIGTYFPASLVAKIAEWDSPEAVLPWGHRLGLLPLDPWQASVVRHFERNELTLVEGRSATGKSHLLTHLVTNALANGKKTLVVAESLGALRQIQEQLYALGVGDYSFLLQDKVADLPVMGELLRGKQKPLKKDIPDIGQFKALEDRLSREQQKLDECYAALRREIFEAENWTQTVGLYLEANRQEGKELLHGQLNASDFRYSRNELEEVSRAIESCQRLFGKINALSHPLQSLNSGIFIHNSEEEGLAFIETQVASFLEKTNQQQHQYLTLRNQYAERLMDHYGSYYREVREQLEKVEDKIRDYQNRYDSDVLNSGKNTLKLYGLFAGKFREALTAKEDIAGEYRELVRRYKRSNYFEFSFPAEQQRLEQLGNVLDDFNQQLDQWWTGLPDHLQEEMMRLSYKTVLPELKMEDKVQSLELNLDLLVEELNGSGLYQLPMERKMLTIPRRQRFLEEIIEKLEETRFHLRDYPTFYDWQHNWFSLSEVSRRVVRALAKIKPDDWLAAFKSWYYNQILSNAYEPILPIRDLPLEKYVNTYGQLEKMLQPAIDQFWEANREKTLKNLKKEHKKWYDAIFDKKRPIDSSDLHRILDKGGHWVASLLPVILTTPQYAAQYFNAKKPVFDAVLVDEGQTLSVNEGSKFFGKGVRQVLFYDRNLLIPTRQGLVTFLHENGFARLPLHNLHQQRPGLLWQTAVQTREGIQIEQVNGRFEVATGTNEEEIQAILQLLNRIEKTPQRTYPKVGIVCFTKEQRNLLSEYLLRIKRQRLTGIEMVQQLERNGLGVFHLSELTGQHFDILVTSICYGQTDTKGKISGQLKALNTKEGLAQIQLMLGRATQQLILMNSLPLDFLADVVHRQERTGMNLLANFLVDASGFLGRSDTETANQHRQKMQEQWLPAPPSRQAHFSLEVIRRLHESGWNQPYSVDQKVGEVVLPIVFQRVPGISEKLLLLPDGFLSRASGPHLLWEYQQRQRLQKQGYRIIPIWSVLWWKNPNQALHQLLQEIDTKREEEE